MKSNNSVGSYPRSVYPGQYIPLVNREELKEELKRPREGTVAEPFINVSDQQSYCKIEVALPGLHREDILINIDHNILSLSILNKKSSSLKNEKLQLPELNYDGFSRHIILPENVETEFVRAEYKEDILTMYLLKTDHPSGSASTQIIVY